MAAAIGPATDRLLVASTAIVVLAITATFLFPATADVTPPGSASADVEAPTPTEGPSVDGPNGSASESAPGNESDDSTPAAESASIAVNASATRGWLIPGREVDVAVLRGDNRVGGAVVSVDGRSVGRTVGADPVPVTVPASESTVLSATLPDGETVERELSVESDVAVEFEAPVSRFGPTNVTASIRGYPLAGAAVSVDGDDAGVTGPDGVASVGLPDGTDEVEVVVREGDLLGRTTLDLELDASVDAGLPVAASRTWVTARYGDEPADVAVYVVGGDETDRVGELVADREPEDRTGGEATTFYLPPASEATIVVTDGRTVRTVVLEDLLRNLAIAVIGVLSIGAGLVFTTLRALRWLDVDVHEPAAPGAFTGLALGLGRLGGALVDAAVAIAAAPGRVRLPAFRLPPLPSPVVPSPSLRSLELPSLALPSLGLPSLGSPSLPSLGVPSLGSAGGEDPADGDEVAVGSEEKSTPTLCDRELIRASVRDLGRLAGVSRVETATPGQIGRRALDAALPREPVERIVGTVRDVEYGGGEPSRDRARRVREAVRRLRDALQDGGERE